MSYQSTVPGMVCVTRTEDRMDPLEVWRHPQRVLGKIRATLMMCINVVPCLSLDEREFIWS